MRRTWGIKASTLAVLFLFGGAAVSLAAVPPPPVNQQIGVPDTILNALSEADCRVCHSSGLPDRHHVLYGTLIPEGVCNDQGLVCQDDVECQLDTCVNGVCSNQPSIICSVNGDADCRNDYCIRDSQAPNAPSPPSGNFECLTCHTTGGPGGFVVIRDCLVCHAVQFQPDHPDRPQEPNVHHRTELAATDLDCVACHGDLVDNWDDGHYVPTYAPSLVTPWTSGKPNSGPNGEGNCNFCHDAGTEGSLTILDNHDTHHETGLTYLTLPSPPFGGSRGCYLCHPEPNGRPNGDAYDIRTCERCHGPESLHNIQADTDGDGIVVGGELAYYGHVGNDDDCFGCHGFASTASIAPFSGPVIPYVVSADRSVMSTGSGADVTLSGVAFTNFLEGDEWISNASWTTPEGTVISLDPASVSESEMVVSVPGASTAGKYVLRAQKGPKVSNPTVIAVKPLVVIASANCSGGTVGVTGSGFGGYVDATDSGTGITSVIGGAAEKGGIVSWTDSQIVADFSECGDTVEVSSVFGSAAASLNPAGACTPASVVGAGTEPTSRAASCLYLLLAPCATVIFWRIRRRRK